VLPISVPFVLPTPSLIIHPPPSSIMLST
jgi:hypothetical protein